MKTIESVLKDLNNKDSYCHNCNAKEGDEHAIKGLKVVLSASSNNPDKMYCQICLIQKSNKTYDQKKCDMVRLIRNFGSIIFCGVIITLLFSISGNAQPPGLPGDPAQAPIDGGLGLLATAGGAYAWKKLKAQSSNKGRVNKP